MTYFLPVTLSLAIKAAAVTGTECELILFLLLGCCWEVWADRHGPSQPLSL